MSAIDPATPSDDPLSRTLQLAAERMLAEAQVGSPTRETALTLLAADALITFACAANADMQTGETEFGGP